MFCSSSTTRCHAIFVFLQCVIVVCPEHTHLRFTAICLLFNFSKLNIFIVKTRLIFSLFWKLIENQINTLTQEAPRKCDTIYLLINSLAGKSVETSRYLMKLLTCGLHQFLSKEFQPEQTAHYIFHKSPFFSLMLNVFNMIIWID